MILKDPIFVKFGNLNILNNLYIYFHILFSRWSMKENFSRIKLFSYCEISSFVLLTIAEYYKECDSFDHMVYWFEL